MLLSQIKISLHFTFLIFFTFLISFDTEHKILNPTTQDIFYLVKHCTSRIHNENRTLNVQVELGFFSTLSSRILLKVHKRQQSKS